MSWKPPTGFRPYWKDTFKVTAYDVDPLARLRLPNLFNYIQEAAYQHATHLGFGPADVARHNLAWVLSSMCLEVKQLPMWNDLPTIETWPKPSHRIFYCRDFILEKEDIILGQATSNWLLIDRDSRKPKYLKDLTDALAFIPLRDALSELPVSPDIPEWEPEVHGRDIGFFDLDQNGHVNTSRYVEWSLASLPDPWHFFGIPFEFTIHFINEIRIGEHVTIAYWKDEGAYVVRGWNVNREVPAWVARIQAG